MSGKTVLGPAASDAPGAEISPIPLLDAIQDEGRPWQELAPRYGVANPDPPWKVSLYAIFECLSAGGALPSLERRHIEDRLGETIYGRTPDPERQLLALADTLLRRGILSEEDLARRMDAVRGRLEDS
jgi:hypothetical protein